MWSWAFILGCSNTVAPPTSPSDFSPTQVDTQDEFEPVDTGEEAAPNGQPKIRPLRIVPEDVYTSTDVTVKINVTDPDGDAVQTAIQWYINGVKKLRNRNRRLDSSNFRKGDELIIEVIASDGTNEVIRKSPPTTVLNSPPNFSMRTGSLPKLDGFVIKAEDPDGDILTFKLDNPPPGLSIDSKKGELAYQPDAAGAEEGGTFETKIIAEDDEGLQVIWPLTVTLTPGKKAERRPVTPEDEP